jgi:hypothetical protein
MVDRVFTLTKQKSTTVAEVGVVVPELVAMVAHRKGITLQTREWLEAGKCRGPLGFSQIAKADTIGPALIPKSRYCLWKFGRIHDISEALHRVAGMGRIQS